MDGIMPYIDLHAIVAMVNKKQSKRGTKTLRVVKMKLHHSMNKRVKKMMDAVTYANHAYLNLPGSEFLIR